GTEKMDWWVQFPTFQSGTGPVTRHQSSKLSSDPINQTNEQSVASNATSLPPHSPPASTTLLEPPVGPFIKEAHTSLHIGPNLDFYHVGPLLVSDGLNDSIYPIKYRRQRWYAWNGIGLRQRGAELVEECDISLWKKPGRGAPPSDLCPVLTLISQAHTQHLCWRPSVNLRPRQPIGL
ncbi:unnamed protein product, partial [Pleuronectes platessa]